MTEDCILDFLERPMGMLLVIAVIGAIAGLVAWWAPRYECVRSHPERVYDPPVYVTFPTGGGPSFAVPIGGGMVTRNVCDQWRRLP